MSASVSIEAPTWYPLPRPTIEQQFDTLHDGIEATIARRAAWHQVLTRADGDLAIIELDRAFDNIACPEGRELADEVTAMRIALLVARMKKAKGAIYGSDLV